jgi:hypothetical protein
MLDERARMETEGNFGPPTQELGRFVYNVDEGPLRERRDLSEDILIVTALHTDAVASLETRKMTIHRNWLPISLDTRLLEMRNGKKKETSSTSTCSGMYHP